MNGLILALMLFAVGTRGSDLTGKWSGNFKAAGGDHATPQLFILKQQGNVFSGTGGPNEGEQYPIENGTTDGSRVRFQLTTGEWKFSYDLKQAGEDALEGDLKLESINDSRTATVSLRRLK